MKNRSCETYQPDLLDYSLGLLDERRRQEIKLHIESCNECRELMKAEEAFARELNALPMDAPSRDMWAMVDREAAPMRRWPPARVWAPMRRAFAGVVAMGVIVFGIFVAQPKNAVNTNKIAAQSASASLGWPDDPLAAHTDAMADVIDDL